MLDERIKRLLDSELETDNLIGWEMIEAQKVPFKDVMDYVENAKFPTNYIQKYNWNGSKFVRNPNTIKGGHNISTGLTTGSIWLNSGYDSFTSPTYTSDASALKYKVPNYNEKVQETKRLGKSRTIWQNIKTALKSK